MEKNLAHKFNIPFRGADRRLFYFLLAIPVINAVADSTIYYFTSYSEADGVHSGTIRGVLLLLFIALFGFRRISESRQCRLIIVFLGYLLLLTLFSSNVSYSFFSGYVKWFVPLMMYPVGLYFIRSYDLLLRLNLFMVAGALVVCVNLIVAQIIDFGISMYVENSFYTGGAGVGITNQLALICLTYPFLLKVKKGKLSKSVRLLIYFVGLISIFFILVVMKRSAIIGMLVGLVVCLYFMQSRTWIMKYIITALIFFILVFPFFETAFNERYESRVRQSENLDEEGRYKEFFYALDEFDKADPMQKLFGKEIFNTGATFGMKYFNQGRMIHGDMTGFFYGAGLVGIVMYMSLYIVFFSEGVRYYKMLKPWLVGKELFAVYFAMLFAYFLISVTGSGAIGERCIVFLYMGGITGVLRNMINIIATKRINGSISADIKT